MNCIVTAGPTYEPLDDVRRLTNFSTGRLGSELTNHLAAQGHKVTLLLGEQATHRAETSADEVQMFSTSADLRERLEVLSRQSVDAVFHSAAVGDYSFGRVWVRAGDGEMVAIRTGKISTRDGALLAELVPTPKIISELRKWYPKSRLIGWKFEVEGDRDGVIALAERQLKECHTNACVANGRAYGEGYGLVTGPGKYEPLPNATALFEALEKFIRH
jgi:phosphopantothenoylcysteine synthetase/decarboxylase